MTAWLVPNAFHENLEKKKRDLKSLRNLALALKWASDLVHIKIKIDPVLHCWFYSTVSFSEFRSLPSFPLASVTMIQYEHESLLGLSQPFPHIDKNGEWIVGGTARGNGSGLERSTAVIWRQFTPTVCISICIKWTEKTIHHILINNGCVCCWCTLNIVFIKLCYEQCPNKNWGKKCLHTFGSQMKKKKAYFWI